MDSGSLLVVEAPLGECGCRGASKSPHPRIGWFTGETPDPQITRQCAQVLAPQGASPYTQREKVSRGTGEWRKGQH